MCSSLTACDIRLPTDPPSFHLGCKGCTGSSLPITSSVARMCKSSSRHATSLYTLHSAMCCNLDPLQSLHHAGLVHNAICTQNMLRVKRCLARQGGCVNTCNHGASISHTTLIHAPVMYVPLHTQRRSFPPLQGDETGQLCSPAATGGRATHEWTRAQPVLSREGLATHPCLP